MMTSSLLADTALVAGKDLRIELRSRTALSQLLPFALIVLVLFAFALDPDRAVLRQAAPGLFWVTTLFVAVMSVQRSLSIELNDGNRENLLLSQLDSSALFLGKFAAVVVQLLTVELFLGVGVAVLYDVPGRGIGLLVAAGILGATAIASAGVIYAALTNVSRTRDTLLPLLLLPVLAPVLIAATEVGNAALDGTPSAAWRWLGLLGVFSFGYLLAGVLSFGSLLEDS